MNRSNLPIILFENMKIVEPYPEKVAPVPKILERTAFFPGGLGLWDSNECERIPSILVLGHDFSTERQYIEMLNEERNGLTDPTWRNLIKLFNEAGIPLEDCFFSNVFIGLRKTKSMTDEFPGNRDKEFVKRNLKFLTYQINMIKPKLIITLGKYAADMLVQLSHTDLSEWKNYEALKKPDVGFIKAVNFNDVKCNCVALEHPSMRNSNVKRRRYGDFVGNEAETLMLKEALHNCNSF